MAVVHLHPGKVRPVWTGHPWVYKRAVSRSEGFFKPGDAVDVLDPTGKFLGRGFISPDSAIMVRILTREQGQQLDADFLEKRIRSAVEARRRLGLPSEQTTGFRLVNSEGDGLGGVVVDVYGDTLVVQFLTIGMKKREEDIFDILGAAYPSARIYELGPSRHSRREGIKATTRVVRGKREDTVGFRESGFSYEVSIPGGQKTGFYFDQRENRRAIRRYCEGAEVLDLFSYTGAFSIHALDAGANSVVAVDSSMKAMLACERHCELNGMSGKIAIACKDVQGYLVSAVMEKEQYDLVIVDPPNFAFSVRDRDAGSRAYRKLNSMVMKTVRDGRILATACCSGQFSAEDFLRILGLAARDADVWLRILNLSGAGPDHPSLPAFEQGRYLKFVIAEVRHRGSKDAE
jgi:23S rRNA (cytosine1962-C5)-methyltransferase